MNTRTRILGLIPVLVGAFLLTHPSLTLAAGDPTKGEAIYNKSCKMCHATGMMGAPKTGAMDAWKARLPKGAEGLTHSAINGIGMMKPRGGCDQCSDEEIANAVAYMTAQVEE